MWQFIEGLLGSGEGAIPLDDTTLRFIVCPCAVSIVTIAWSACWSMLARLFGVVFSVRGGKRG